MAVPSKEQLEQHAEFRARERKYEEKYYRRFLKHFQTAYIDASKIVDKNGPEFYLRLNNTDKKQSSLEKLYMLMYTEIILNEAVISLDIIKRDAGLKKDIIDDLASIFPFKDGTVIKTWRDIIKQYLRIRILTRITQVTETTVKLIGEIVQRGLNEGKGGRDIAKDIRDATNFNRARSLMVARTEAIAAMNQGKYLSAVSSPYQMEKNWIYSDDERTRETHRDMVDYPWIDLKSNFVVPKLKGGDDLGLYPGDSTMSAGNVINCRCSVTFRVKRDEEGNILSKL